MRLCCMHFFPAHRNTQKKDGEKENCFRQLFGKTWTGHVRRRGTLHHTLQLALA